MTDILVSQGLGDTDKRVKYHMFSGGNLIKLFGDSLSKLVMGEKRVFSF